MAEESAAATQLDEFEAHYQYDTSYMREMLAASPDGFATFQAFLPMGQYRRRLGAEALAVAKLTAMRTEDCGACVQLNIRMGLEVGVSEPVLRAVMADGEGLPEPLRDVHDFARAVASNQPIPDEVQARIQAAYSREELVEFALAIAATRVYPAIKRTLGYAGSCAAVDFDYSV